MLKVLRAIDDFLFFATVPLALTIVLICVIIHF